MVVFLFTSLLSIGSTQLFASTTKLGYPWHPSHFVWSLAYPQSVDVSLSDPPYEYGIHRYNNRVKDMVTGSVIWINSSNFLKFKTEIFPKIKHPFILVMTGSDSTFPDSFVSNCDIVNFLNDSRVIHVFTQNLGSTSGFKNLSPIPIGLNFHNLIIYPFDHFNSITYCQSIEEQEYELFEIIEQASEPKKRINRILCDFQLNDTLSMNKTIPDTRTGIAQVLSRSGLADMLSSKIKRKQLWEMKSMYAFSASPHGNGLDCHRTWEDLALGCIVIVRTSSLDCLYEGLPVAIVNDWDEVTQEKLDGWLEEFGDTLSNPEYRIRLTHDYWMDKIQARQVEFLVEGM